MLYTKQVVDRLKDDALLAEAALEGAIEAHRYAAERFWRHSIQQALEDDGEGSVYFSKEHPLHLVLDFVDEQVHIRAVGIRVDFDGDVTLEAFTRGQNGRWSKSLRWYDIEWVMDVMRVPDADGK
jgi:hypothetical protein